MVGIEYNRLKMPHHFWKSLEMAEWPENSDVQKCRYLRTKVLCKIQTL
jgi:hypothetical protein